MTDKIRIEAAQRCLDESTPQKRVIEALSILKGDEPGTVPEVPSFDYEEWVHNKIETTPVTNETVEKFLLNLPSYFVWGDDGVAREVYSARLYEVIGGDLAGDFMEVELFRDAETRIVDPDVAVLYYDPSKVQPTAEQAEANLNIWFARQLGVAQDGIADWNQTYGKRGSSGITESRSPGNPPPPPDDD